MKLQLRGQRWHLVKRVPKRFAHVDARTQVWVSLRTDSEAEAKKRAVEVVRELENLWLARSLGEEADDLRFDTLSALAASRGFAYRPSSELAKMPVEEISRRVLHLRDVNAIDDPEIVGAVLGGAEPPRGLMLGRAADEFLRLKAVEAKDKGRNQRRLWENAVKRSFARFADVVGDKPVEELTREDARAFRAHWSERIAREGLSAASANREIAAISGALRALNLLAGLGDAEIFRKLRFSAPKGAADGSRPPYESDYILTAIYAPGALDGLNDEARAILDLLINTGMRPSEVVGLTASTIRLDAAVPHVSIAPRQGREIKTRTSIRDIPLVGAALAAVERYPEGFPRYADREPSLCQTINKYLKAHNLKPTPKHCVYSFRHGFQDRLIAVEAPDRIQADLMGHRYVRERYGKGPSLAQKADWLQRVALAPSANRARPPAVRRSDAPCGAACAAHSHRRPGSAR